MFRLLVLAHLFNMPEDADFILPKADVRAIGTIRSQVVLLMNR